MPHGASLLCMSVCVCLQESQKDTEQTQEERRAREKEHKTAERQLQKDGKKPFFLKKCKLATVGLLSLLPHIPLCCVLYTNNSLAVRKQLELAEKYKQLKRRGRLEKYLAKKRRRNAQRDRRQLPFKRQH